MSCLKLSKSMFNFFRQRKIAHKADRRSSVQLVQPQPRTTVVTRNISTGPIYRLSQELIDEIIDALSLSTSYWWELQRSNLSNCSLVCRSFLPRSQMHLFSCIELLDNREGIFGKTYPDRIKSFLTIIDNRPSIAGYVQDVRLVVQEGRLLWISDQPDMNKLLSLTATTGSPIRKLTLIGKSGFSALEEPFLVIERSLRRNIIPYITSLSFHKLKGIPPQLVAMCPNLEELRILSAEFLDVECAQFTWTNPPTIKTLECVSIGPRSDLSRVLHERCVILSKISELTVFVDSVESQMDSLFFEQKVIDGCTDFLEVLTVDICAYERLDLPLKLTTTALNLKNLRSLHTLTLIAFINDGTPEGFSDVCSTLQTLSKSQSKLDTLRIILRVWKTVENLGEADWKGLCDKIDEVSASSGNPCRLELFMYYYPLFTLPWQPGDSWKKKKLRAAHEAKREAQQALHHIAQKWFISRNVQTCKFDGYTVELAELSSRASCLVP